MIINVENMLSVVKNNRELLLYLFVGKVEEHDDKPLVRALLEDKEFHFIARQLGARDSESVDYVYAEAMKLYS